MASSSGSTSSAAADIWRLFVQLPTRALCKRYQRAAGCDRSRATAVLQEYKRLLALKVLSSDFDDKLLAAPPTIHQMWREHLVDTAAYAEHCRTIAGRLIHHDPEADEDEEKLARRAHRSAAAYKRHFGEPPPPTLWDFGELRELGADEIAALDAPPPKRPRTGGAASTLSVSVQAPYLPLRTLQVGAESTVRQLFAAFTDAAGATHLVAGRASVPPTTRLRHGSDWLHDLQQLVEAGVREGSVVYVACPVERKSRDQLAITVNDVNSGESAPVFVRSSQPIGDLMAHAQDALGVPADCQQLIFAGKLLNATDALSTRGLVDGSTVQMAVGRRREKDATMSPGGTWR